MIKFSVHAINIVFGEILMKDIYHQFTFCSSWKTMYSTCRYLSVFVPTFVLFTISIFCYFSSLFCRRITISAHDDKSTSYSQTQFIEATSADLRCIQTDVQTSNDLVRICIYINCVEFCLTVSTSLNTIPMAHRAYQ